MKSLKKLGFFAAFLIPALVVIGNTMGGLWNYLCIGFVFVLIPILDYIVGKDDKNPDESTVSELSEQKYYRFITFIWVYVQVGIVVWGAYAFAYTGMVWFEKIGFLLGLANVTGGIGITVAHELGHQKSKLEQFYSKIILMTVSYMHFFIEHNKGHHVWVATPKDPATSRKGEHFYSFWIRTVTDGFLSAWQIETDSLKRKNIPVWSYKNEMLWYIFYPIFFCVMLTIGYWFFEGYFSWQVPLFFVLQSIFGFSLLELVNYIEHYGIVRKEIAVGKYERVNPLHSWNANQLLSNFFLFQLQRHSDHHANASRRYQVLRHIQESPQLPQGYPAMIILAMFPPLWFKIMDKRLQDWQLKNALNQSV